MLTTNPTMLEMLARARAIEQDRPHRHVPPARERRARPMPSLRRLISIVNAHKRHRAAAG